MTVRLFDVQSGFGGVAKGATVMVQVDELLAEMTRLSIGKALVRTLPGDLVSDQPAANAALFDECGQLDKLVPCPVLLPDTGCDVAPVADQIAAALDKGAGAGLIRPKADYWSLKPWVCDGLFHALEEARLPIFCNATEVSLEQVGDLASRYPSTPFIVAGVTYRVHRVLLPLLHTFPNVYLSIGSNYAVHLGLELLVREVGPERLLFGTGFPTAEPMAAIALLLYADMEEDSRAMIGAGNIERLLGEIRR